MELLHLEEREGSLIRKKQGNVKIYQNYQSISPFIKYYNSFDIVTPGPGAYRAQSEFGYYDVAEATGGSFIS